jgi:hypothetical protein
MARPSALGVFRLMTSSNLVRCRTEDRPDLRLEDLDQQSMVEPRRTPQILCLLRSHSSGIALT